MSIQNPVSFGSIVRALCLPGEELIQRGRIIQALILSGGIGELSNRLADYGRDSLAAMLVAELVTAALIRHTLLMKF